MTESIRFFLRSAFLILISLNVCFSEEPRPDADSDGIPDAVERRLGSNPQRAEELVQVWARELKEVQNRTGPQVVGLAVSQVADDRSLWKVDFAAAFPKTGATFILYLDADNDSDTGRRDKAEVVGTDIMYVVSGARISYSSHGAYGPVGSHVRGERLGNSIFLCHDMPYHREGDKVRVRARLLAQQQGANGSGTDWFAVEYPSREGLVKPHVIGPEDPDFRGLTGERVRQAMSGPYPERRARPSVPFFREGRAKKPAAVRIERIPLQIAEEDGIARRGAPIRFGFPLPKGALFDPSQIRLLSPSGREQPAQFTITSFWKDQSIRWLIVTFLADLAPKEKKTFTVELGSDVKRAPMANPLKMTRHGDALIVDSGEMKVRINTKRFGLFDEVAVNGRRVAASAQGGIVLTDTNGGRFTTAGADCSFRVEEEGPLTLSLCFDGAYTDAEGNRYFHYTTRLRFYAGSRIVDMAHTHTDDWLEYEFADFRSLETPIQYLPKGLKARVFLWKDDGALAERKIAIGDKAARLFQRDDAGFVVSGLKEGALTGKRAPGIMALAGQNESGIGVSIEDFWRQYPGAISANAGTLKIELFPDIRAAKSYSELPKYLRFPFVGGSYRFKWGMSKTHRARFDFGLGAGETPTPAEPIVAVLPSEWYERTGALGPMVAKREGEFPAWDEIVRKLFKAHLKRKEDIREYGFFNWGDWYGERGSNWGNNEYDLPHALFVQFARTGERDYCLLALAGARHQGDVDCIHAYPDPAYVGGNVLHSVFHTGEWSQHIENRSWSFVYGHHAMAFNGHTWSEGMCDAWYLFGDARVMECAQGLGEHIVYGMVPRFKRLGTHERSAGWSLIAIVALYRATLDPLYLDAARQIAEVAFREQNEKGTGGWPHVLPADHCLHSRIPGAKRCVGNVAFLIGILKSGLKEYYLASGDERARKSIEESAPWWKTVWDEEKGVFRYTSCPLYQGRTGPLTSMLCADAVAFDYKVTGDPVYREMLTRSFVANLSSPPGGFGKSLAQYLRWAPSVMAAIRSMREKSEAARSALTMDAEGLLLRQMSRAKPVEFIGIRSPETKVFYVKHEKGTAESIVIERRTHGARTKQWQTGTVVISAPDSKPIKEATFDTDKPFKLEHALQVDSPTGVYRIEIRDDMRGIWDVKSSGGKVVVDCSASPTFGNYKFARIFFFVPEKMKRFRIGIFPIHGGPFGAAVFGPSGKSLGVATGIKEGYNTPDGQRWVEVQVPKGEADKVWSAVLFAGIDLRLQIEGAPPYFSASADGWFEPRGRILPLRRR